MAKERVKKVYEVVIVHPEMTDEERKEKEEQALREYTYFMYKKGLVKTAAVYSNSILDLEFFSKRKCADRPLFEKNSINN